MKMRRIPTEHIDFDRLPRRPLNVDELEELNIDERLYEFMKKYQYLYHDLESCWDYDRDRIIVNINDGREFLYDIYNHKLQQIKTFDDLFELTEEEFKMGFSALLRHEIWLEKINQGDLADQVGVSTVMLSRYCQGKALPNFYILSKIVEVIGCSFDDLIPRDYIPIH